MNHSRTALRWLLAFLGTSVFAQHGCSGQVADMGTGGEGPGSGAGAGEAGASSGGAANASGGTGPEAGGANEGGAGGSSDARCSGHGGAGAGFDWAAPPDGPFGFILRPWDSEQNLRFARACGDHLEIESVEPHPGLYWRPGLALVGRHLIYTSPTATEEDRPYALNLEGTSDALALGNLDVRIVGSSTTSDLAAIATAEETLVTSVDASGLALPWRHVGPGTYQDIEVSRQGARAFLTSMDFITDISDLADIDLADLPELFSPSSPCTEFSGELTLLADGAIGYRGVEYDGKYESYATCLLTQELAPGGALDDPAVFSPTAPLAVTWYGGISLYEVQDAEFTFIWSAPSTQATRPQWAPDGQAFYYVSADRAFRVSIAGSASVGEPEELFPEEGNVDRILVSPRGDALAVSFETLGLALVPIHDGDLGTPVWLLDYPLQYHFSGDGSTFLLWNEDEVVAVDPEEPAQARRLPFKAGSDLPQIAPDGRGALIPSWEGCANYLDLRGTLAISDPIACSEAVTPVW